MTTNASFGGATCFRHHTTARSERGLHLHLFTFTRQTKKLSHVVLPPRRLVESTMPVLAAGGIPEGRSGARAGERFLVLPPGTLRRWQTYAPTNNQKANPPKHAQSGEERGGLRDHAKWYNARVEDNFQTNR